MGTDSEIAWCDHTLNFWRGCTKVSAGCDNCYMYRQAKQYGWDPTVVTRCGESIWRQPNIFNPQASPVEYKWKAGDRVFVCSWSDFFHEDADQWRHAAWAVIRGRPDLNWIITTKRIEEAYACLPDDFNSEDYPNIMFMPTCENQEMADKRIPPALELKEMYRWIKIGVSIEPILGAINLEYIKDFSHPNKFVKYERIYALSGERSIIGNRITNEKLDQVIVGGESGPGARPMHPDWARGVRDQCVATGVPFFFKQWGEWLHLSQNNLTAFTRTDRKTSLREPIYKATDATGKIIGCGITDYWENGQGTFIRVGKKKAGCLLDGKEWRQYPKEK